MSWGLQGLWVWRILVASRVSALSVAAGVLLFLMAPPARDLFADLSFGALPYEWYAWLYWGSFFAYLVFLWAFPVHYAARRMLRKREWMFACRARAEIDPQTVDDVHVQLHWWIKAVPRILAMVPFAGVLVGLWRAHAVVATTLALPSAQEAATQIRILGVLDLVIGGLFLWFLVQRDVLTIRMSYRLSEGLAFGSAAIITLFFIAAVALPFFVADVAPRASIIPVLLGSFIFGATYVAWVGHRVCIPVLTLSVVAALTVTSFNAHFNDVRTVVSASDNYARRQIDIDDAVAKWRKANCDSDSCPPALIVAAEGGASRAAFAAATAIGELIDESAKLPDAGDRAIAPGRRIFAISGVSGGSFAAATVRAALADSLGRGQGAPPCQRPATGWFRRDTPAVQTSWRACLQALVAGDYLTPAFVGLAFRDNFSPPAPFVGGSLLFSDDRAVLIERAWERHYDHVVRGDVPEFTQQALEDLTLTADEPNAGLRRKFGFVSDQTDPQGSWFPLLLLNGTSVGSGIRIVTSDLVSTRAAHISAEQGKADKNRFGRFSIYPAASDTFEILSKPCPRQSTIDHSCSAAHDGEADRANARSGPDIRMSTAAMLSARFPIISPAGTLRSEGDENDGDRVVDGGYFENAGLTTAMDVAREVRRLGVVPLVLWVQNGPTADDGDPASPSNGAKPPPVPFPPRGASAPDLNNANPPIWEQIFGIVLTPVVALTDTREGHGVEAASAAQRELWELNDDVKPDAATPGENAPPGESYFTFGMYETPDFGTNPEEQLTEPCARLAEAWKGHRDGSISEVSMSWWLSQSVQAELDLQVCDRRNRKTFADLMTRLAQHCPLKARYLVEEEQPAASNSEPKRCAPQ